MITNQQPQEYQNSHSRVIYKNFNDTDTRDFLNSYRYEPSRNRKYKKWKPDISPEERFKKKRDREEEYLQNFHPDDRPVLVVQRKHEYQDIDNPNVFMDPAQKEAYYKVSENTDTIDDITYEIKALENFIKRHTLVHKKNKGNDDENLSSIYRVEGKEFLPEGFVELDPLLYKDEYEFDNKLDMKRFEEEQRKLKMLRRKQYEQRNDNKVRDVTIFVMDEQKNRTLMFLEKWVNQHRRKMNNAEIEYVSENLQVDPHKLKKLQDLYFKKMEILRNRQFGTQALTGQSHLKDIPSGIKSQFQQRKFEDVDSKYMKSQKPYQPAFLNKYQKKPITNKKNQSNQNSQQIDKNHLDETLKETSQDKNKQTGGYSQLYAEEQSRKNSKNNLQQNISRKTSQKSQKSKKNSQVSFQQSKGNLSKKQSQDKKSQKQSQGKFSDQFQQSSKNSKQFSQSNQSKQIDDLYNPFEQILNNEDNLKVNEKNNDNYEQQKVTSKKNGQNFENDLQKYFDDEINSILNKIKKTDSNKEGIVEQNNSPQPDSKEYIKSFKQKLIQKDDNLKQLVNQDEQIKNRPKQKTQIQNVNIQKLPKRLTIFSQNQKGDLKTTFKLKPIILGNEYFYQTIEQKYNQDKTKQATLITKNDQGQFLDVSSIPQKKIGKHYTNEVHDKQPDFQGDLGKEIIVKNDKGEIVHKQVIRPRQEYICMDKPEDQLKIENFKKEKIQEDDFTKIHNLNPISYNGKEYKQVIEEVLDKNNNEQINVLTYDDDNKILSKDKITPFFKTETYYSQLQIIDLGQKQKRFSIITRNKNGEVISEVPLDKDNKQQNIKNQIHQKDKNITIHDLNPVVIGDKILKQQIHINKNQPKVNIKTFNDFNEEINNQQINKDLLTSKEYSELIDNDDGLQILTKNQKGKIIGEFQLPQEYNKVSKNDKFDEIVEIVDNDQQRRATVAIKALPEFQFRCYQLRPTLIGNQFYQQTINELMKGQDDEYSKAVLITKNEEGQIVDIIDIDNDKIAQDYYNQILEESIDKFGKRKATLVTYNNNNDEIGRVEISQSLAQKTSDQHYQEVLEQLVNEDDDNNEQVELIIINNDNDGNKKLKQIQVDKQQLQELDQIPNDEYFNKLVDIFADKQPRRSFQKDDGYIVRDKAQTYAQIPIDYQNQQLLTKESKKQIDQFVKEVNQEQQQQLEQNLIDKDINKKRKSSSSSSDKEKRKSSSSSSSDKEKRKSSSNSSHKKKRKSSSNSSDKKKRKSSSSSSSHKKKRKSSSSSSSDKEKRKSSSSSSSDKEKYKDQPQYINKKQKKRNTKQEQNEIYESIKKNQIKEDPNVGQNKQNVRKSQVSWQGGKKYDPLEGYKKAKQRVRSKTKQSQTGKKQPMSFEEMEKKLSVLENKKSQLYPDEETRSKHTSVIGKDFRPSMITKIYEDKYGGNQIGSERFKKEDINTRDYSKTMQPQTRGQNLLDFEKLQKDPSLQNINDNDYADKDISILENKEFLQTEKEIQDVVQSQKNIDQNNSNKEIEKQQQNQDSKQELENNQVKQMKSKKSSKLIESKYNQNSKKELSSDKNINSKRSIKKPQSKNKLNSKKELSSDKNINSKRSIKKPQSKNKLNSKKEINQEEQVVFEGLKQKSNFDEIIKKKLEDQDFDIQNPQIDEEEYGSNITPKDLDKSYASAVTYELKKQVDRDKDLVDRLAKAAGLSRGELLEDFYDFCVRLPRDQKYKESIVFATMFYYYMEMKKREIQFQLFQINILFTIQFEYFQVFYLFKNN